MEFIRNTQTGSQLDRLNEAATKRSVNVIAAVAYVTDCNSLIKSCFDAKKQLRLFARYDYSGPVSEPVLNWFLSKGTLSGYELRLVPDIFHPKVIWWKGVGVYIGSANLSKMAWSGNIEAGIFVTEDELDQNGMRSSLEAFFEEVAEHSHALTSEIAMEMIKIGQGDLAQVEAKSIREFRKTRVIPLQNSLVSITKVTTLPKKYAGFFNEWTETLQLLREIGDQLSLPGNSPAWVPRDTSRGVRVDQFLHAYYYNQVKAGSEYPYRGLFNLNSANPQTALREAIKWWSCLTSAPTEEAKYINDWAPKLKKLLSITELPKMSVSDFQDLCGKVHSMREHAKRLSATTLGLTQDFHISFESERVKKFGTWLHAQKSSDGSSTCEVIHFVLYGGEKADLTKRLFSACYETEKKIPHLGISSLGELVGWAMPNDFPPRNGRTSKALTALGFEVNIHSE